MWQWDLPVSSHYVDGRREFGIVTICTNGVIQKTVREAGFQSGLTNPTPQHLSPFVRHRLLETTSRKF